MLHGGNIYGFSDAQQQTLLDFSANISPLGMPGRMKEAMMAEIGHALHYPDPLSRRLCQAVGKKMKIDPSWLIFGNGAADIVYRFVYGLKPGKAVVIHPTFVEYEEAMRCTGTEIAGYCLNHEDFKIKEDILEMVDTSVDAVFICNPNNPTGVLTEKSLLVKILEKAKACGAFLVLDECFLDFTGDEAALSMSDFLDRFPNLVILKSFTKMYAVPGVRIGYGICSDMLVLEKMRKAGQSWSVSTMAESAGIAALAEDAYKAAVIDYVSEERRYLEEALAQMGIRYIHGHANYILIRCPGVSDLYDRLLCEKIMIRTCGSYENLGDDYYRIAINRHEDNVRLTEALKKVLAA